VAKLGTGAEMEASTLAHSVLDIQDLCRRISAEVIPTLLDSRESPQQMTTTLAELGELLREVLYHVRDPQYFRYLPGCENENE
jgi:hypothetical protein